VSARIAIDVKAAHRLRTVSSVADGLNTATYDPNLDGGAAATTTATTTATATATDRDQRWGHRRAAIPRRFTADNHHWSTSAAKATV
jgi:hypothetical protein